MRASLRLANLKRRMDIRALQGAGIISPVWRRIIRTLSPLGWLWHNHQSKHKPPRQYLRWFWYWVIQRLFIRQVGI